KRAGVDLTTAQDRRPAPGWTLPGPPYHNAASAGGFGSAVRGGEARSAAEAGAPGTRSLGALLGGRVRIGVDGRYLSDAHPGIGRTLFPLVRGLAGLAGSDDEIVVLHDPTAPCTRLMPGALAGPRVSLAPAPIAPRSAAEQVRLPGLVRDLRL